MLRLKLIHVSKRGPRMNIYQTLYLQKTPHTSPLGVSYGLSFVIILKRIDHLLMITICMTPSFMNRSLHTWDWSHFTHLSTLNLWFIDNKTTWCTYYQHGSTLILAQIRNNIHYKVWDEITYPFTNFNGVTIEVCEWIIPSHTLLGMWLLTHAV